MGLRLIGALLHRGGRPRLLDTAAMAQDGATRHRMAGWMVVAAMVAALLDMAVPIG
jgi:hypothetical protein